MVENNLGRNIVFPIYNADGTPFHDIVMRKATFDSTVMSLGDKITGDVYYKNRTLPVSMNEYIIYNGVKYRLVNPPTLVREGMVADNSELKGMSKFSFEFYHPMYMLANFPFADVAVSADENRYKSQDKTFSWIGYIKDFVNKLNKNLDTTEWVVVMSEKITDDKKNTLSEVLSFDNNTIADALKKAYETWEVPFVIDQIKEGEYFYTDISNNEIDYYSEGKRFVILFGLPSNEILVPGEELDYSGSISSEYLRYNGRFYWLEDGAIEARKGQKIHIIKVLRANGDTVDNWTLRKAKISSTSEDITSEKIGDIVASAGNDFIPQEDCFIVLTCNQTYREIYFETYDLINEPFIFQFGQGVGLKNNSRTPKNNKIITRIAGYGSEDNIPYGYPQIPWLGDNEWENTKNNPDDPTAYPIYDGILGGEYVKLIKHPFTRNHLMPSIYVETLNNKINPLALDENGNVIDNPDYNPNIELIDYYDADDAEKYPNIINLSSPSYEIHQFENVKPELGEESIVSAVAYNMQSASNYYMYPEDFERMIDEYISEASTDLVRSGLRRVRSDYFTATEYQASAQGGYYDTFYSITLRSDKRFVYITFNSNDIVFDVKVIREGVAITNLAFEANLDSLIEKESDVYVHDELVHIKEDYKRLDPQGGITSRGFKKDGVWDNGAFLFEWWSDGKYTHYRFESKRTNFFFIVSNSESETELSTSDTSDAEYVPWDDTMDDDGNYIQSYFKITLPVLDFDLYACAAITQEMKINMRSGACIGCTFTIQCDWEDYKLNFYDDEGNFVPRGTNSRRDFEKYPDSSKEETTVIVQKDIETFGTLMPNIYQQPKTNDKFVILGISLPQSYVTRAQERLDGDMKEYMLENNVYYFEYPLKFDEYFLANNTDILSQIKNNTIIRFLFTGEKLALYVKQITIKYGENVLPQYNITLTDDVEIVLNQIGQVTDDVSRLRVQVSELQSYYDKNIIDELATKLSKTTEDNALEHITFNEGLSFGRQKKYNIDKNGHEIIKSISSPSFVHGFNGAGFSLNDSEDNSTLEIDNLVVRKKMSAAELEILKKQYTGGNLSIGSASCTAEYVTEMSDTYRIYFKRTDGEKTVENLWQPGDMARCQTFNIIDGTSEDVSNHYWWRLVISVGTETFDDGTTYNYIDVSSREEQDGKASNIYILDKLAWTFDDSVINDIPQAGDMIVQEGNVLSPNRQNLITIDVIGEDAPSIVQYQGIGSNTRSAATQYNLANYQRTIISPKGNKFVAKSFIIEVSDGGTTKQYNLANENDFAELSFALSEVRSEFSVTTNAIEQKVSARGSRNLLNVTSEEGWTGDVFYNEGEFYMGYDGDEDYVYSPLVNLDPSKIYCVSVFSNDPDNSSVEINDGADSHDVNIRTGETYKDCERSYMTFTNAKNVRLVLYTDDGFAHFYNPQIEEVNSLGDGPTEWTNAQEELSATIRTEAGAISLQATNQITAKVNNTGVNIEDGTITLSASKTIIDKNLSVGTVETKPVNGQYFKASGSVCEWYGAMGVANIRAGIDEFGQAIFEFYDNSGTLLYNLGSNGITKINNLDELFTEHQMKQYNSDNNTPLSETDWNSIAETYLVTHPVPIVYQYRAKQTNTENVTIYYAGQYCYDKETAEIANNRYFEKQNTLIRYNASVGFTNSQNQPLNGVYIFGEKIESGTIAIEVIKIGNKEETWEITYGEYTSLDIYRYKDGLLQERASGSDASKHIIKRRKIGSDMDVL